MKKVPSNAEIVVGAVFTPVLALLVLDVVFAVVATIVEGRVTTDDILFSFGLYFFSLLVGIPSSLLFGLPMAFILREIDKYRPVLIISLSTLLGGLAMLVSVHFMRMNQAVNDFGSVIVGAGFGFIFGCVFSFLTIYKPKRAANVI